jgi:hypothetical protein
MEAKKFLIIEECLRVIKERLWEIKAVDVYEFVKAYKICLTSDIVFLWKFKVSQFAKYISIECPKTHLSIYCSKMVEMIKDDKLFIYFFYESLSGNVLFWYISLDGNKIRQWTNLIESFML